jgi:hypothetical protein
MRRISEWSPVAWRLVPNWTELDIWGYFGREHISSPAAP